MSHALLGPSGAKRWMSCTPSARFEEQFAEEESDFAAEGTAAHALAEAILSEDTKAIAEAMKSSYYNGEMQEAIGFYVERVTERYNAARARSTDAILMLEQRLDFSDWVPEGFGTGDVVIIADGALEVIDLKYGKGVPVDAKDNPQLKLYGLGAYQAYSILYDINTVRMTIIQPRLDSLTTDEISVDDLVAWADEEVKPKAQQAWTGEGEYCAGDHCKFCKGRSRCKALADKNLELAKFEFAHPNTLTNEDIADILKRVDALTSWASSIKDFALDQAVNHGVKWPGWKLVEGRSNRKYVDDQQVLQKLVEEGYQEPLLYKPREVLGITAMETLVGKKKLTDLLGDLIIKPAGKPVLAPESDNKPELNSAASAKADFS